MVGGEDPDAGDGGKVAVVGDELHHAVVFHGFIENPSTRSTTPEKRVV
ncbi:MAG: hypothetical protein Q8O60_06590 [Deltaproteobacteria bacterium]|nr:hypothetical protein [Deltaproteobacteria bacterium]